MLPLFTLLIGCGNPSQTLEPSVEQLDTGGSWPTPEIEAEAAALQADTVVTDTMLSLYNVQHHLRITGIGKGGSNFDREYRIQLSSANGVLVDTLFTKASFSDSLDHDFFDEAGLYLMTFDLVRSQSLYFNAFVGVDETDYVQPIDFFLTYAGIWKGRMYYWLVQEDMTATE